MLKRTVEVYYHIERYMTDAAIKAIDLEIATGSLVDGEFVSDGRSLIKLCIANIQDSPEIDMGDGDIIPAIVGRAWFDEQAAYVQSDHPEHVGQNNYDYIKSRLWNTIVEMGLLSGEVI